MIKHSVMINGIRMDAVYSEHTHCQRHLRSSAAKLKPIIFDPSFNTYRVEGEAVGNAFKDGLQLK